MLTESLKHLKKALNHAKMAKKELDGRLSEQLKNMPENEKKIFTDAIRELNEAAKTGDFAKIQRIKEKFEKIKTQSESH